MFRKKSKGIRLPSPEVIQPRGAQKNHRLILYRDMHSDYRWRLRAPNGRIISDSAEGYATKDNLKQAVKRFQAAVADAEIVESAEDF